MSEVAAEGGGGGGVIGAAELRPFPPTTRTPNRALHLAVIHEHEAFLDSILQRTAGTAYMDLQNDLGQVRAVAEAWSRYRDRSDPWAAGQFSGPGAGSDPWAGADPWAGYGCRWRGVTPWLGAGRGIVGAP